MFNDISPFLRFTVSSFHFFRFQVLLFADAKNPRGAFFPKAVSRSTSFAILCTAQISKIRLKIVNIFAKLNIENSKFQMNQSKLHNSFMKNAISRRNGDDILSEFREHVQKCPNSPKMPVIFQIFKKQLP